MKDTIFTQAYDRMKRIKKMFPYINFDNYKQLMTEDEVKILEENYEYIRKDYLISVLHKVLDFLCDLERGAPPEASPYNSKIEEAYGKTVTALHKIHSQESTSDMYEAVRDAIMFIGSKMAIAASEIPGRYVTYSLDTLRQFYSVDNFIYEDEEHINEIIEALYSTAFLDVNNK